MKLYKIKVLHAAPKDSHESVETYLIAKDDEEVMNWINKEKHSGDWFGFDDEDEENTRDIYDDDFELVETLSFRDWVLKNKGDLSDDEGWGDAYYGVTKWGWEEVVSHFINDLQLFTLVEMGIAVRADAKGKE